MAKFLIRRPSPNDPISGFLPASASAAIGTAYTIASKDPAISGGGTTESKGAGVNTFELADGDTNAPVGFVTRPVRQTAGLSPDEILFGLVTYKDANADTTGAGEIMTPFEAGKQATIEEALDVEVEDPDNLVTSGTGAVAADTAVGTLLAFRGGKLAIAQSTEYAHYRLTAQMTAVDGGTVRIFAQKIDPTLVAA